MSVQLDPLVFKAEWWQMAACRGVRGDIFYPERGESLREAKAICDGCPVRVECLDYALQAGESMGVWGGKSTRERILLKKRARQMAHP